MNGKKRLTLADRVLILETKFDDLLSLNRWQLGLIGAILAAILGAWITR